MLIEKIGPFKLHKSQYQKVRGRQAHYWTLVAANGRVLATSEMYVAKAACLKGIQSAITNVTDWRVEELNRVIADLKQQIRLIESEEVQ